MQEIKSRGLTRDAIKMIAMLTMFFNHFSHVFLTAGTYPAELRWCPRCPIFWHLTERRQS